jgi:putative transposase
MKAFFALLKRKNEGSFSGKVSLPRYKEKESLFTTIFPKAHFRIKDGKIKLTVPMTMKGKFSKKFLEIPFTMDMTNNDIVEVRIIPKGKFFTLSIVYKDLEEKVQVKGTEKLSIDYGISNLLSTVNSSTNEALIVKGGKIKSLNRYFNKEIGKSKSELPKGKKSSKRIRKMWNKRENIFRDYFHKLSKSIIQYCMKNGIDEIIIGYNQGWKKFVNLGAKTNQNFVQIPYAKLNTYLTYKGEERGIKVTMQEESYTSKSSSLSLETMEKKDQFCGRRIKRGLYLDTTQNKTINADVNGALNILRKCKDDSIARSIISSGLVFRPKVLTNF